MRKEITKPIRFRSYRSNTQVDEVDCAIWEAARATSAASSFFNPITIGRQNFTDGATGFNNPVELVVDEASELWPGATQRIERLVSLGTGKPELKSFGETLKQLGETLIRISTETESTAERFERVALRDYGLHGKYFRFNVSHGLGDVGLESRQAKGKIIAATNNYLINFTINQSCKAFAAKSPCA
jgi:predicted acylesterase/phospholipase RssA